MLLGLYRVGDCVMHLCPICNRRTINVLDDDDDDDDDDNAYGRICEIHDLHLRRSTVASYQVN